MLKRIKTDTSNSQIIAPIQSEETFSDILIRITGTGVAATQLVGGTFGRVQYWKRNELKVDVPMDWLRVMVPNVFGNGNSTATMPAAATAVEYAVIIPRSFPGEHNVDHVTPADNARIQIMLGANAAAGVQLAANPTTVIELLSCKGVNLYDLTLLEQQFTLAANQTFVTTLSQDNISMIMAGEITTEATPNWSNISLATATGLRAGNVILDIGGDNYNGATEDFLSLTNQLYGFKVGAQSAVSATAAAAFADNILWTMLYDASRVGVPAGNGMADTAALTLMEGTTGSTVSVLTAGRRYSGTNLALSIEKLNRYKQAAEYQKTVSGRSTAVRDLKATKAL